MKKKTLLITGISGFLGNQFIKRAAKKYKLVGTYHTNSVQFQGIETYQLDLQNASSTKALMNQIKPDVLFHLAALSNPNFCEQNADLSLAINVLASERLAKICESKKIPFIFTSTDLVFDGQSGNYNIDSPTKAICLYGKHKRMAEEKILSCLLYTSPSPRDATLSRMPSSA